MTDIVDELNRRLAGMAEQLAAEKAARKVNEPELRQLLAHLPANLQADGQVAALATA